MARVRDRHVGTVQGALGDQVFKVVNGESYVAELPHTSNKPATEAMINHRKQFGLTMKLSKGIYEQQILRPFWKVFTPEGTRKVLTTSMKIAKSNYHCVTPTEVTDLALLAPDFGFPVTTTDIALTNSSFTVEADPLGDCGIIDTITEKYLYLVCVAHLSDPTNSVYSANRFLSLKSSRQNLSIVNPLTFTIDIDGTKSQVFDAYTTKKAFFVLVTTDINDAPVHFSSTFHTA